MGVVPANGTVIRHEEHSRNLFVRINYIKTISRIYKLFESTSKRRYCIRKWLRNLDCLFSPSCLLPSSIGRFSVRLCFSQQGINCLIKHLIRIHLPPVMDTVVTLTHPLVTSVTVLKLVVTVLLVGTPIIQLVQVVMDITNRKHMVIQ